MRSLNIDEAETAATLAVEHNTDELWECWFNSCCPQTGNFCHFQAHQRCGPTHPDPTPPPPPWGEWALRAQLPKTTVTHPPTGHRPTHPAPPPPPPPPRGRVGPTLSNGLVTSQPLFIVEPTQAETSCTYVSMRLLLYITVVCVLLIQPDIPWLKGKARQSITHGARKCSATANRHMCAVYSLTKKHDT